MAIPTLIEALILTVAALLPIMNPFSTAPLFVSLTAVMEPQKRKRQAFLACCYAFAILAVFLLLGSAIIDFFGISIAGIRVAGGLIIATLGFRMLFPAPPTTAPPTDESQAQDVAFTPLAMPSMAGPGSIAVVLSAAAQIRSEHAEDWKVVYAGVILGMAATLVFSFVILRLAGGMVRFLGRSGIDAMTRIFGFLLVCIAMQFLLTGVADFYGVGPEYIPTFRVTSP